MARPDFGRPGATATCKECRRMVHLVTVDGERVATDPEVLSVVRYGRAPSIDRARRLHSERCEDYQQQARRTANTAEMRRYTQRQQQRQGRRGFGL